MKLTPWAEVQKRYFTLKQIREARAETRRGILVEFHRFHQRQFKRRRPGRASAAARRERSGMPGAALHPCARRPPDFGTPWERDLAKELKGAIVEVGIPASHDERWC